MNDRFKVILHSPAWRWYGIATLALVIGWLPWILDSGTICAGDDWGMFLHFYEAVRKSLVEYGQFPYWNPWHLGGTPMFARPQIGVIALETPLIVMFGTVRGINLAMFAYAFLGMTGMWFLSEDLTKRYPIRVWLAVLFGLQGTFPIHLLPGHVVMTAGMWIPWLFFTVFRIHKSFKWSLAFGLVCGLMYLASMHYLSAIYSAVIGIMVLVELIKHRKNFSFYYNLVGAGLFFIMLAGYRIIVTWELFSQFPRVLDLRSSISPLLFLKALIWPGQDNANFEWVYKGLWPWHEIGCYVGIIALIMFALSCRKKLKWYHWGFILTLPLALDSEHMFLPGYWLRELPVFKSMYALTRWRFVTVFCLIAGAGVGMDYVFTKLPEKKRWLIYLLMVISFCGLTYNLYHLWFQFERRNEAEILAAIPYKSDTIINSNSQKFDRYGATAKGVGLTSTYDSLLSWAPEPEKTIRMSIENPKYRGEIFTLPTRDLEVDWSPNQISLTPPLGVKLFINQNPSCYWRINDKKLFPQLRDFELNSYMLMHISSAGEKVFTLRPARHEFAVGFILTAMFLMSQLILIPLVYAKLKRPVIQPAESTTGEFPH
jgi:hypothetical protein